MQDKDGRNVLTIKELNELCKNVLEATPLLRRVYVKGEISNFNDHRPTNAYYFSLKEPGAKLECVAYGFARNNIKFKPENGMKVVAYGKISLFVRDGRYQLYVDGMEPEGLGSLQIAYEQLYNKLKAEGLFDESNHKPLPKYPETIGVVTSPTGAAIKDILDVLGRRFPYSKVLIYPSLVQGDAAPETLIRGLRYFNETNSCNVIIIGRGGGSYEDLWAFNDEKLAREIFYSHIPVISAVGHERDWTIADYVADKRAPTPSAAAEIAVPDTPVLKRQLSNVPVRMEAVLSMAVKNLRRRVKDLSSRGVLSSPMYVVEDRRKTLANLSSGLSHSIDMIYADRKNAFTNVSSALPRSIDLIYANKKNEFTVYRTRLNALDPMSVVKRGYSAVFDEKGVLIKSVDQVEIGDKFCFRTTDGVVDGEVKGKKKDV